MERKGKPPRHDQPSFSSTLLDAIYRSMDESDGTGTEPEKRVPKQSERLCYKLDSYKSSGSLNHHRSSARTTKPSQAPGRNRSGGWAHSTSSSSDGSSYGGFSSSEAESVRLRPIRTAPRSDPVQYHFPVQSSTSTETKKSNKSGSIKSRIKEFRKTKNQLPASPGARLTSILNALFAKKTSSAPTKGGGGQATEVGSTCSSASSNTRSCLSKTPSTVKRSVRFCPVSVVVGEEVVERGGDRRREAEGKKRMEEILRGMERDEEEEEESSDSSSDLFELEDLTVGVERRFRHELPVYCTTSLGNNNNNNNNNSKGVSHGLCRPVI
ncbi:Protein BIG GRAIN 1 [Rhynchospora pubera]|uniref:Protein BIG GRAIN 1 n=1 Tax=Rhynchospora pubera TaxID=906938 RepID=A0AAV8FT08_9POAL|nr:Protein BIG GRAIN 1 [Rhynchospora pubera]